MPHPGDVPVPDLLRAQVRAIHTYDISGCLPGTHLGLPSAATTWVIDLGTGLALSGLDLNEKQPFDGCLSGLCTAPVTIHHDGSQRGVMLYLTPLGTRTILRMPVADLTGTVVATDLVLGPGAAGLQDRMRALPLADAAQVLIDDLIGRVGDLSDHPDPPLGLQVWDRLVRASGRRSVASLAQESGWSERHLRNQFCAELGLGMSSATRLLRFEAALDCIDTLPLKSVAADCGYADQAHLSREWLAFTGMSPLQWRGHREFVPA